MFACFICINGQRFCSVTLLYEHFKSSHNFKSINKFQCVKCKADFYKAYNYKRHLGICYKNDEGSSKHLEHIITSNLEEPSCLVMKEPENKKIFQLKFLETFQMDKSEIEHQVTLRKKYLNFFYSFH